MKNILFLGIFLFSFSSYGQIWQPANSFYSLDLKNFVRSHKAQSLIKTYDKQTLTYHRIKNKETRARIELYQHTLRVIIQYRLWKDGHGEAYVNALLMQLTRQMNPKVKKTSKKLAGYTLKPRKQIYLEHINTTKYMRRSIVI